MNYNRTICITALLCIILYLGGCMQARHQRVCFKDTCFNVEVASTREQRQQGLMFREHLGRRQGMVFVFDTAEKHSFWMENTLIPLDIVWLNKNKEVVFIKENAQPCRTPQCPSIRPDAKALYVLEVNAGMCEEVGVTIGDRASFHLE